MPLIPDYRTNFRSGRTGAAMRGKIDAGAYKRSVQDARNMMVLPDGALVRRWGTLWKRALGGEARLEAWDFTDAAATSFLLVFEVGKLTVYDRNNVLKNTFTLQPWTADNLWFFQTASSGNKFYICDQSFRTRILTYDADAGTFSMGFFEFARSLDSSRLNAPFYDYFGPDVTVAFNIWNAAGMSTGYESHIVTAMAPSGAYSVANGTGLAVLSGGTWSDDHVGVRFRIFDGEFTVTSKVNATTAAITVHRDLAVSLDVNPFFMRKDSRIVEVTANNHNLEVGDEVFFVGIAPNDLASVLLTNAVHHATSQTAAPAPSGGAATYVVQRVTSPDAFEITDPGGTVPTNTELGGGADVQMFYKKAVTGLTEQVVSAARGGPQAVCFHENRLWLGGLASLPDAVIASRPFVYDDFDPGEGLPDDAIAMFGIGEQARIRHLVPGFDLMILSDSIQHYVPGSVDSGITPETVRAVTASRAGASHTTPHKFDRGLYFIEAAGKRVMTIEAESRDTDYFADNVSVVVPDWVSSPYDSTLFRGSRNAADEGSPLLLFVNDDGTLLVMHSSRIDEAFGFMRWDIEGASFTSICCVGHELFAVVKVGSAYHLVQFDTSETGVTYDLAEVLTGAASTSWASAFRVSDTVGATSGGKIFVDAVIDVGGNFATPESVTTVTIGRKMPYSAKWQPPIAAVQGAVLMGRDQCLVRAEVGWRHAAHVTVNGDDAFDAGDVINIETVTPIDDWRTYHIGEWGKEPALEIAGLEPGRSGVWGVNMWVKV